MQMIVGEGRTAINIASVVQPIFLYAYDPSTNKDKELIGLCLTGKRLYTALLVYIVTCRLLLRIYAYFIYTSVTVASYTRL